jgi:hypothetical protein
MATKWRSSLLSPAVRPLVRVYLVRSFLLWCGFKVAGLFMMAIANVPDPLSFHLLPEAACFIMAWLWLGSIMRRNGEDILLANLGLPVRFVFALLLAVMLPLSLLLSLAA